MSVLEDIDYFTDVRLCEDPYPYFEKLRAEDPVGFEQHHGVAIVSGYKEALAVYNDAENFSACNATCGPVPPLPFVPKGDDIGGQIDAHRGRIPSCDLLITYDRPEHSPARSLPRMRYSTSPATSRSYATTARVRGSCESRSSARA